MPHAHLGVRCHMEKFIHFFFLPFFSHSPSPSPEGPTIRYPCERQIFSKENLLKVMKRTWKVQIIRQNWRKPNYKCVDLREIKFTRNALKLYDRDNKHHHKRRNCIRPSNSVPNAVFLPNPENIHASSPNIYIKSFGNSVLNFSFSLFFFFFFYIKYTVSQRTTHP